MNHERSTAEAVRRTDRPIFGVYYAGLVGYAALSVGWLMIGAVATLARYWPGFQQALDAASDADNPWLESWSYGFLVAAKHSEPLGQAVLDYGLSALSLAVALALLLSARQNWSIRLLALALVGAAGAFNLQAHMAIRVVQGAFDVGISWWHLLLLHGVGGVAYVLALVLFPTGRWDLGGRTPWLAKLAVAVSVVGVLALLAGSTTEYPHTVSFVVFFGVLVPVVGLVVQRHRARHGETPEDRRQSRLLFSALTVAVSVVVMLGLLSAWLWLLGAQVLTMFDPTAHGVGRDSGEPAAVVFWPVRLIFAAVPFALIIATSRARPWDVERLFSRALASVLLLVLIACGWIALTAGLEAVFGSLVAGLTSFAVTLVVLAVAFQAIRERAERLVDRLIYGSRPAPNAVLSQVAEVSGATDHPDLGELAEVVAHGLGASYCRLTVHLSDLGDRCYQWPADLAELPEHVTLPVHYGGEEVGAVTVDRTSVASVPGERARLADDLVGVLGPVLYNSRLGIELEHQLRTALDHAEEIAESRRRATADMDHERRTLERDLHDGAQHHLVALRMTVGLVEHELSRGRQATARDRLEQVVAQVDGTRRVLANTAAGVFPVLLAEQGLLPALSAELGDAGNVVLDIDEAVPGRRFPLPVETAVYFTCLEAINNSFKHAPQATVRIALRCEYRGLAFAVSDDGPGFDLERARGAGRGLHNLADRANAVGGSVAVRSAPGEGTTVEGFIPL
ncbi:sensor histidine kinase [Saccharopolyspora taberi]|uniref:Histidine kinase domain-containing protein n=1 Tax=Saccharopolyspora taberi TaxID=60895 RepID=A0ABN3VDX4_9PSEU